ncbi:hypothetical protein MRX96_011999 [Rhipicephalus microplus]
MMRPAWRLYLSIGRPGSSGSSLPEREARAVPPRSRSREKEGRPPRILGRARAGLRGVQLQQRSGPARASTDEVKAVKQAGSAPVFTVHEPRRPRARPSIVRLTAQVPARFSTFSFLPPRYPARGSSRKPRENLITPPRQATHRDGRSSGAAKPIFCFLPSLRVVSCLLTKRERPLGTVPRPWFPGRGLRRVRPFDPKVSERLR